MNQWLQNWNGNSQLWWVSGEDGGLETGVVTAPIIVPVQDTKHRQSSSREVAGETVELHFLWLKGPWRDDWMAGV